MSRFPRVTHAAWRVLLRTSLIAAALVGLGLVIAWLSGAFVAKIAPTTEMSRPAELANQQTSVVTEVTKDYVEEVVGTLKAEGRTIVSAKVLATIEEITVSAGDQVHAGDVLIQLNSQDLEARLKQAEQMLIAATATRKQAEVAYARSERLVKTNAVSQAEFDESVRRLEVSRAQELGAEQALNESKVMLSYATIKAPRDGRIVDRLAEPGDTSRPGEPLLVLYDVTSLRLEAPVPEQLAVKLRPGDKLKVYIDALERATESTIDEIVPQADAPSRSFLVKAKLSDATEMFEGMFGRLYIPAGQRRHLCLDTAAIERIGQLEFVNVVTPEGQIEQRFIKTGRVGMPGHVEVLSGLKQGERVILGAAADPADASETEVHDG